MSSRAHSLAARLFRRGFKTSAVRGAGGEAIALGPDAPVLVQLEQRTWAPLPVLASSQLPSSLPSPPPASVAVVRDAFASFDTPPRPLSSSVRVVAPGRAVLAASAARASTRLLADAYVYDASLGAYVLASSSQDLASYLSLAGVRDLRVAHDAGPASHGSTTLPLSQRAQASPRSLRQSTNHVLMVAPSAFAFNQQCAQDNTFMHSGAGSGLESVPEGLGSASIDDDHEATVGSQLTLPPSQLLTRRVLREYAGLYRELADVAGVRVSLLAHDASHGTPDAVFPNNWFSTHAAGEGSLGGGAGVQESTLVLYPMAHPNRRAERRADAREFLESLGYARVLDLSFAEAEDPCRAFEGTGVLVLDRLHGVAYVALSERADERTAREWAAQLGYGEVVAFRSTDGAGGAVYHTNVMMAVGTDVAVVCLASVEDPAERGRLRDSLARHRTVVDVTREQMADMCGNVLELEDGRGLPVLAMSTRAYRAFGAEQRAVLRRHVAELHHAPIDTLEFVGGGGVRCCLAELFLP